MSDHTATGICEWHSGHNPDGLMVGSVHMITDADEGMVISREATHASADWSDWQPHLAVISGSGASMITPGGGFHTITPVLQLEDGSFAGTASASSYNPWGANHMIAFDSAGNIRWSVAGYTPKIATADGGVLAPTNPAPPLCSMKTAERWQWRQRCRPTHGKEPTRLAPSFRGQPRLGARGGSTVRELPHCTTGTGPRR